MSQGTLTRAEELAAQVEATNDAIIAAISDNTTSQWQRITTSEVWPVGVVAHHVSEVQSFFAGLLAGLSNSDAPLVTLTSQDIDENNARHAREFAAVSKQETLDALQERGAALARSIRDLDNQQLARISFAVDGNQITAEQVVEFGVIGHFNEHLQSIRAALAD